MLNYTPHNIDLVSKQSKVTLEPVGMVDAR